VKVKLPGSALLLMGGVVLAQESAEFRPATNNV
jgi:hypothetical protein